MIRAADLTAAGKKNLVKLNKTSNFFDLLNSGLNDNFQQIFNVNRNIIRFFLSERKGIE